MAKFLGSLDSSWHKSYFNDFFHVQVVTKRNTASLQQHDGLNACSAYSRRYPRPSNRGGVLVSKAIGHLCGRLKMQRNPEELFEPALLTFPRARRALDFGTAIAGTVSRQFISTSWLPSVQALVQAHRTLGHVNDYCSSFLDPQHI